MQTTHTEAAIRKASNAAVRAGLINRKTAAIIAGPTMTTASKSIKDLLRGGRTADEITGILGRKHDEAKTNGARFAALLYLATWSGYRKDYAEEYGQPIR